MDNNLYLRNLYLKKFNQKVDKLIESIKLLNQVDATLGQTQNNNRDMLISKLNSLNQQLKSNV
jgi:hypothetical protein